MYGKMGHIYDNWSILGMSTQAIFLSQATRRSASLTHTDLPQVLPPHFIFSEPGDKR